MLLLLALACQPKTPEVPIEPSPPPQPVQVESPPPVPTGGPPPPPPGVVPSDSSSWISSSCGAREYERVLTLLPNFTYTTEERIAPCPPDVTCVWSGIVLTQGQWSEDQGQILFKESSGGPQGEPRPSSLRWSEDRSQLIEEQGTSRCVYTRVLATPPEPPSKTP